MLDDSGRASLPESTSPRRGTAPETLLELTRKVELVHKATLIRNLGDRKARMYEEVSGGLEAFRIELLDRRLTFSAATQLQQMLS
jgi:hypothetical protein